MEKRRRPNATSGVIGRMREDVLRTQAGVLFGSEESLLATYRVSRPALREILSALISEELLTVRRGYGGGYFTNRPSESTVSRVAGTYLTARHSTLAEAVTASLPLRILVARLAARSSDEARRQDLAHLIESDRLAIDYERGEYLASERQMLMLLGRMAGNAVIELFLTIVIAQSSRDFHAEGIYRPEAFLPRMVRMRQDRAQLLLAVQARDEELAELFARRCVRSIVEWMKEDGQEVIAF